MAQTMAEHLIERGKAQGLEQGREQGCDTRRCYTTRNRQPFSNCFDQICGVRENDFLSRLFGSREELEPMAQTMAEHQGQSKGLEQGREEGATQAKQAAVLKLLRNSVPESVINQITLIRNLSRLDSLFEKALNAKTLDEIDFRNHDSKEPA